MTEPRFTSPAAAMAAGACSYVIASAAGIDHPCGRRPIVAYWWRSAPHVGGSPAVAACATHDARIARDTAAADLRPYRDPVSVIAGDGTPTLADLIGPAAAHDMAAGITKPRGW